MNEISDIIIEITIIVMEENDVEKKTKSDKMKFWKNKIRLGRRSRMIYGRKDDIIENKICFINDKC